MTDINFEDKEKGYGVGCDKNMSFRGKITKDGPDSVWLEIDEKFDIVDDVTRTKVSLFSVYHYMHDSKKRHVHLSFTYFKAHCTITRTTTVVAGSVGACPICMNFWSIAHQQSQKIIDRLGCIHRRGQLMAAASAGFKAEMAEVEIFRKKQIADRLNAASPKLREWLAKGSEQFKKNTEISNQVAGL